MNSKRQTVWLVSMLSLMVVLSAYYLLTGDSSDGLKDTAQMEGTAEVSGQTSLDTSEVQYQEIEGSAEGTGLGTDEADAGTDKASAPTEDSGSGATSGDGSGSKDGDKAPAAETGQGSGETDGNAGKNGEKPSADSGISPEDQAVLQQMESQMASSRFIQLSDQSQERANQRYDEIMKKISDVKQDSESSTKALAELEQFEARQDQIESLRKELGATYKNIVIDENGKAVTVVVQSDKLAKSEAAAIITKVSTTLNINAGDVLVKYVS